MKYIGMTSVLMPVLVTLDLLVVTISYVGGDDSDSGIDETRLVIAQFFKPCMKKIVA